MADVAREAAHRREAAGDVTPLAVALARRIAADGPLTVEAFMAGSISFPGMAEIVERTLEAHTPEALTDVAVVFGADTWARHRATEIVARLAQ